MFNNLRSIIGVLVIASLALLNTACPKTQKDKEVAFARDLIGSITAAVPIVAQKSPALAGQMQQWLNGGSRLIDAINASNATQVAALIRDILPIFTSVAETFSNDQNVLIALALGQIALNFFVNHYVVDTSVAGGVDKATRRAIAGDVGRFLALPQFGCQYRPDRCK